MYNSIKVGKNNIDFIQKGDGENLLFFHGFGVPPHKDLETIDILSSKYRVIAPKLAAMNYLKQQPKTFLETFEIAKSFKEEMNIDSHYLLGHSFGGKLAIELAKDKNINSKAVIALNPVIPTNFLFPQISLSIIALKLVREYKLGTIEYISNSLKKYLHTRGLVKDVANSKWDDFENVLYPTLILHTREDDFFKKSIKDLELNLNNKNNLEVCILDDYKHFFHKQNKDYAFNIIDNFFSKYK